MECARICIRPSSRNKNKEFSARPKIQIGAIYHMDWTIFMAMAYHISIQSSSKMSSSVERIGRGCPVTFRMVRAISPNIFCPVFFDFASLSIYLQLCLMIVLRLSIIASVSLSTLRIEDRDTFNDAKRHSRIPVDSSESLNHEETL